MHRVSVYIFWSVHIHRYKYIHTYIQLQSVIWWLPMFCCFFFCLCHCQSGLSYLVCTVKSSDVLRAKIDHPARKVSGFLKMKGFSCCLLIAAAFSFYTDSLSMQSCQSKLAHRSPSLSSDSPLMSWLEPKCCGNSPWLQLCDVAYQLSSGSNMSLTMLLKCSCLFCLFAL